MPIRRARFVFAAAIALLAASPAAAQSIRAEVMDAATGAPVAEVRFQPRMRPLAIHDLHPKIYS